MTNGDLFRGLSFEGKLSRNGGKSYGRRVTVSEGAKATAFIVEFVFL